ncbi:MAG: DUF1573 domain-containing protein [Bacteroidales bacterium]|jgi:hypothetical protein|nr:DUF1573 domain-containing protein [Bacteroidales bacterium]
MKFLKKALQIIVILIASIDSVTLMSQTDRIDGPIAVFDIVSHDFGNVLQGKESEAVFKLTNKGDTPLIIEDIKVSCGCTLVEWTKDPILPEQTSEIIVKYNTKIIGAIKRSIVVNTNDRENDRILLMLTGNVVATFEE